MSLLLRSKHGVILASGLSSSTLAWNVSQQQETGIGPVHLARWPFDEDVQHGNENGISMDKIG